MATLVMMMMMMRVKASILMVRSTILSQLQGIE